MKEPSYDEIAIAAHSLWKDRGCPEGIDNEIWLEAERQLRGNQPPGAESRAGFTRRVQAEAAAESRDDFNLSAATTEQQAIKAAVKAPQGPRSARGQPASPKGGSGQRGLG
jgi:hypothetical protein